MMRIFTALALLLLTGCDVPPAQRAPVADAVIDVVVPVADAAADTQTGIGGAVMPVVVDVREVIESVTPDPSPSDFPAAPLMTAAGLTMLVHHEIVSPAYYTKRLQGIACPGGASGPTRGIGWDDGMQTRARIAAAWHMHPQIERILPASGQTGAVRCRQFRVANRDIITPYPMAEQVFADWALPDYHALTARTFRNGFDALPPEARDSLVMTVYNRGAGMSGPRRAEMRVLRDDCVPRGDVRCMAVQYRSMPRLWVGMDIERGMKRRYEDTALHAERALQ